MVSQFRISFQVKLDLTISGNTFQLCRGNHFCIYVICSKVRTSIKELKIEANVFHVHVNRNTL